MESNMKKLAAFGIGLLLATAAWTYQSGPVAVIIQVDGAVQVEQGGAGADATVGTRLAAGDRIVPSSGASAVLIQRGGTRIEVGEAYTVEAPASGSGGDGEMFSRAVEVLGQVANADTESLMDRQGMIRPIPGEPVLVAPRNELTVMAPRPTFTWTSVDDAAGYTIQIRRPGSRPMRFGEISDTTWTFPASAPSLIPGEEYWWTVAPAGSGRATREQRFTVIDPAGYETVTRDLRMLDEMGLDPAGEGAFLAAVAYRDAELYYDAVGALELLERSGAALGPDAYLLKGEVLTAVGDAEGARRAFDRADEIRR
jgi:hypothetical protein